MVQPAEGKPPSDLIARSPRRRVRRIVVWTLVVFEVVGVFSAVDAIMSTRTAQGAIAWSVSLVTVPVVAVPAYWVFGRSPLVLRVVARVDCCSHCPPPSSRLPPRRELVAASPAMCRQGQTPEPPSRKY
jgi:hypothetical protein